MSVNLSKKLNELALHDNGTQLNFLAEHCFTSCVHHFRSKQLNEDEKKCVERCVVKYLTYSQRVAQRFQEYNVERAREIGQA